MNIIVAGDYCPQNRVAFAFEKRQYEEVLGEVKPILASSDYSIVNFECPVTNSEGKPISKLGPNLYCDQTGVDALKWGGFNCVTLANNHFRDYGDEGVRKSLSSFTQNGIDYVGGGMSINEASQILYKEIGGEILAIINCCEHEFSIASDNVAGSNPLNPIQQYYDIQEAKTKAHYVLIVVHGGHEYYQLPSPRMQETYRFFVDAGADAVVNHHQHCFSGYEIYKKKPIFYGLGNFCFDWKGKRKSPWNEGYMVKIAFSSNKVEYEIISYNQCDDTPSVAILDGMLAEYNLRKICDLNAIIKDKFEIKKRYDNYIENSSNLGTVFSPFSGRILNALCARGIIPSFISAKKRKQLLAYIQCESHFPKVIKYLKR
jgi:poly-gamma-glutamate synthesis protein (capsule biosynthesis protein)